MLDATWQTHVMRASDGSHYVAVRALVPGAGESGDPLSMYVRLATHRSGAVAATTAERSAVKEWLSGLRGDPLPMQAGRSMSVPQGEMPVGGAAVSTRRATDAVDASSALRLMAMQQERAARDKAEQNARRLAELENGAGVRTSTMLPFEDFDFTSRPLALPAGGLDIRRGITVGPGTYDVFIAWSTGQGKSAAVQAVSHRITLPAAAPSFGLSDLIVAEAIAPLATQYSSAEQSAHAYAIGALDVTPAIRNTLSADGTLGLVFQVINPAGTESGKPSVEVGFQVSRVVDGRSTPFGALQTQRYDETNVPHDFDTTKAHPLFGAVRASLATFPRGRYRVDVTAIDRVTSRRASAEVTFDVRGTADSLLREAPTPGQAFRRDSVLAPATLAALSRALRPPQPSEPLAKALAEARDGRFAEIVAATTAVVSERPAVQALMALGLYGLGDSPRAVGSQLSQALAQGAPPAPVWLLHGAVMALTGDDKGAIAAWDESRSGIEDGIVAPLLIDAYLRQGDIARAAAVATAALDARPDDLVARRSLAATYLATRRFSDAIRLLDSAPARPEPDPETDFLVVHALYAGQVVNTTAARGDRARFESLGQRYVDAEGRHADLVREWLAIASTALRY